MLKDARGVSIKIGDIILFQGILMVVEKIEESMIVTGAYKTDPRGQKVLPGKIICSCGIECNTLAPVNCFVLGKDDSEIEADKKKKEQEKQVAQA